MGTIPSLEESEELKMNVRNMVSILILASLVFLSGFDKISDKSISDRPVLDRNCTENGGQVASIEECNGEKSKICVFPGKVPCYIENVKDGKCTGIFRPKVLCDS